MIKGVLQTWEANYPYLLPPMAFPNLTFSAQSATFSGGGSGPGGGDTGGGGGGGGGSRGVGLPAMKPMTKGWRKMLEDWERNSAG
jgi:hypothetical protein